MRYLITQLTLPLFLLGANVYSQDNDVRIWGVSGSGTNGLAPVTNGYIFSVNPDGSDRINYKVFESSVDGARPFGKLIEGSDGFYYGTTKIGGTKNNGVIYRVKPDGTEYTKIIEFDRNTTGSDLSEIIEGSDGKLYGILRIGGKLFSVNKDGSGFYVVYNFGQNTLLSLGMTLASDGFLYGTGTFDRQNHIGSVFKVQTNGTDFQRIIDIDEANTYETKVFEGHDGMLYFAGAPSRALWRINKAGGQYEKVRVFDGKPRDVIQMPDHTIVGVFFNTLFKVDPNGDNYSSLYSFTQCDPQSLSLASNGKLYGTGDDGNQGMIFRIDANGSNISVLRSLGGFQNGVHAQSVIETSPGNFIGPALDGAAGNNGAIFTITDGGAYVKRKEFPEPNGNNPMTKLLLASDGYLYGTTENGGQNGGGTLFRISKDGSGFTRLFDFEYQYYDASSHTRTSLIEAEGYLFGARMNYVFRIAKDGTGFTKINETFPNGTVPFGNMIVGQDGVIYGLKSAFNLTGGGYVYKINTNGTGYAEILDLAPAKSTTGSFPTSIMQLANGKLVITTSEYGPSTTGAIFSMNTDGSDISIVKSNNNGSFTSVMGNAPLEASNGLLYNTTFWSTPIYSMQTDGTNYREPSTMFSGSQFVGSLIEISKKRLLGVNGWSLLSFNIETDQIMAPSLTPGIFTSAGITAVSKNVQTVTLNDISSKNMGDPAFVVSATSSLSLPITYTSSNTAVATIVNDIVTIVGAGTATIKAYQPGNITVSDASDTKTLTVFGSMPFEKSTQQITFNNLASRDVLSPPFNLEASASSGLAVSYASSNPDVATIEGTLLTIMGAGETTVTATQNGNETYKAAEPVAIVLKIVKVNQSITFGPIAAKMIGASPFDLSATSSSGLSIVYSTTSDKVTIQSSKVILNKPGRATIKAEQTGNAKYNAAAPVEQSFCINPLKPIISTTANVAPSLPRTFGSSSESGNQWFKDGQPIAGATNVNYTATEDGKYSVQVTVDDCQTMSDNIVFTISGVNEIVDAAVLVYPNPAMDEAIVRVDGELSSEVIIELYDVLGRQIDTRNSVARRDERFDVSKLGTGVFLFKIIIDDRIVIRRMIRN